MGIRTGYERNDWKTEKNEGLTVPAKCSTVKTSENFGREIHVDKRSHKTKDPIIKTKTSNPGVRRTMEDHQWIDKEK